MHRKLQEGDTVKVIKDGTEEFLGCVGQVFCFDGGGEAPIGVAFGKADNTVPLRNGKWGAWFSRDELRYSPREDISPIRVTP